MNLYSFRAKVVDGGVAHPSLKAFEGQTLSFVVEPLRSVPQLHRYFGRTIPRITEYINRHRQPGELPKHDTEVRIALERAFLGVRPVELTTDSLATVGQQRMSEFMSRVESHFSGLGVNFEAEE